MKIEIALLKSMSWQDGEDHYYCFYSYSLLSRKYTLSINLQLKTIIRLFLYFGLFAPFWVSLSFSRLSLTITERIKVRVL